MKKKIFVLFTIAALSLTGCGNKAIFDTTYTFDRAIIQLADGTIIDGKVDSWLDFEGEQLQIKVDGITYLVNSINCTLIKH